MFREMRRKNQLMSRADAEAVLAKNTHGVLALSGDDGYPYAVPLSYIWSEGSIYFHCAKSGHKIEAIRANDKVSFCVVDQDEVVPEKFTTFFRSVVAFGRAHILEEADEIRAAIDRLAEKYSPHMEKAKQTEINQNWNALCMVRIEVEHLTGKEAVELVNRDK